jgi:cytochrome c556
MSDAAFNVDDLVTRADRSIVWENQGDFIAASAKYIPHVSSVNGRSFMQCKLV